MRKASAIMADLKTRLETSGFFGAVVLSSAQVDDQIQQELRVFGKHMFPAVIVAFEAGELVEAHTVEEFKLKLVVVDIFRPGTDAMALRVFAMIERLRELFPPRGHHENGCFYVPGGISAMSADPMFVCFAQQLTVKQGVE